MTNQNRNNFPVGKALLLTLVAIYATISKTKSITCDRKASEKRLYSTVFDLVLDWKVKHLFWVLNKILMSQHRNFGTKYLIKTFDGNFHCNYSNSFRLVLADN